MSLGLVAYDDSEESEDERSNDEKSSLKSLGSCENNAHVHVNNNSPVFTSTAASYVNNYEIEPTTYKEDYELDKNKGTTKTSNLHLPESKLSLINTDIDIRCLTSSSGKSGHVKITVPSINEVTDESEPPSKKKIKPSQKGSGLFALLPCPKSTLIPQSVTNKKPLCTNTRNITPAITTSVKPGSKTSIVKKPQVLINYDDSGDENESETVDFFSLGNKDMDIPSSEEGFTLDIPEVIQRNFNTETVKCNKITSGSTYNFSTTSWQATEQSNSEGASNTQPTTSSHVLQTGDHHSTTEFLSVCNNDLALDQQAMQQLCARRDRLKMQEVNLIDVSGDAIMPDSREWLTKQLTEETIHRPSHKRKDGPTTQQKRKHQITYLAYQAKENELELKNQWANNRMSRKQTQAKYGF